MNRWRKSVDELQTNRWRKSVDELQTRKRQVWECERAQEALSKVTSCFQQLASCLGSTADCSFLREELDETRTLAHRICTGLSRRLLSLLSEYEPAGSTSCPQEREHAERMWVVFLSAVEHFLLDLHKASDLIGQFPLTQRNDRRSLLNTGSGDGVSGVAARAASVQMPWLTPEEQPCPDLISHLAELDAMLRHMQQKVSVPFWSVEAVQPLWAEFQVDPADPDAGLDDEDLMEEMEDGSHDNKNKMAICCHPPCCPIGCMLCMLN